MAKKRADTAVDRLASRIADLIEADRHRPQALRRSQTGLADFIGVSKGTLSEMLHGKRAEQGALARLDKIAEYFGVPTSFLVRRHDTPLMELQHGEFRLLLHWRRFPPSVQQRMMEVFDYFAGLLPEEQEARRWWHRVQLIRNTDARRAIERAIDDALREQRYAPDISNPAAAEGPSVETRPATQPQSTPPNEKSGR